VGTVVVPEFTHPRMPLEHRLNDPALHAATAAVNQPHFLEPRVGCGGDVLVND
jgi:hypothetical protein